MPRHRGTAHHFNTDSSASYLNRNGLTIEALGRYRRELPIASSGARRLVKAMICAGGQDRMRFVAEREAMINARRSKFMTQISQALLYYVRAD